MQCPFCEKTIDVKTGTKRPDDCPHCAMPLGDPAPMKRPPAPPENQSKHTRARVPPIVEKRFETLRLFARINLVLGILALLIGIVLAVLSFSFGEKYAIFEGICWFVGGFFVSLQCFAIAELFQAIVSAEHHAREAVASIHFYLG
jgi:hypothetical protein